MLLRARASVRYALLAPDRQGDVDNSGLRKVRDGRETTSSGKR